MGDLTSLGAKLCITSPRIIRKAKEYCQLVDIRSSNASLSALKMTGSCQNVVCLDLAASTHGNTLDRPAAVRLSGNTKKMYTMSLKAIESLLDLEQATTVRDMAVKFGCTGAVDLAQKVFLRYEEEYRQRSAGDMDFNTSLFHGAALCVACKKLKIRVDRGKVKELCGVKTTCFDSLVAEMEKHADNINKDKKVLEKRRATTLLDEVERQLKEEAPGPKQPKADEEQKQTDDYEDWKQKILENARKLKEAKS